MAVRKSSATAKTPAAAPRIKAISERFTKTQMLTQIAENTDLPKKEVQAVLDELSNVIAGHLKKRGGCGDFVLPGLMKITTVKKPARKARKGINPFTGEETTFKAKPASVQVKIRPLKKFKEMAE